MGAKHYAVILLPLAVALSGCANWQGVAQRLAPPGIIKYEELAGDQPINPAIEQRVETRREAGAVKFPKLSAQPAARPQAMPVSARTELSTELRVQRDVLQAAIESDLLKARVEREGGVVLPGEHRAGERSLDEAREALDQAVAKDDRAARRERGLPPRPKVDDGE